MLISELIVKLESVRDANGDLPVATWKTESNGYESETVYETCKDEYLNVAEIEFEDTELDPDNTGDGYFSGPRRWLRIPRNGLHLVIDAT